MSEPIPARTADLSSLQSPRLVAERSAAQETASKTSEPTAWDAYEVWRTRVLLPRLKDQAREN